MPKYNDYHKDIRDDVSRSTSIEGQWEDIQEIEHTVKLANGNFAVIIERQGTLPEIEFLLADKENMDYEHDEEGELDTWTPIATVTVNGITVGGDVREHMKLIRRETSNA